MEKEFSLKVSKNIKHIKVNDEDEYITINLDDQTFIPRLIELMEECKEAAESFEGRSAEISKMPEGTQADSMKKIAESAAANLEMCSMLKAKIDEAFHDEVCRKVFGEITPSMAMFAEFFEQLGGLLKKFGSERNARLEKYTKKYHELG